MPRTFIAFALSEINQDRLVRIKTDLDWTGADIKWVDAGNIHLTLRFLGNISDDLVPKIAEGLADIFAGTPGIPVTISRLGAFPSAGRPKVIWAGIDDPEAQIVAVYTRLQEFLIGLGLPAEDRPFAAHLTIGRVRRLDRRHVLKNTLSAFTFEPPLRQSLTRIVLYLSALTPAGPLYSVLVEVSLRDMSTPRE